MNGDVPDGDFAARRARLKSRIDPLDRQAGFDVEGRRKFFETVYDMAGDDAAAVPWADLKPKEMLTDWLAENPGNGRTALDVACGLGDNAEALAAAGWKTTAFDLSEKAVAWARQRFPESNVDYCAANLLEPPSKWVRGFDLVHECYTIQSVPPELHDRFSHGVAQLVKPGGTLLVYTRRNPSGQPVSGPPWPLDDSESEVFSTLGFDMVADAKFDIERPDRTIAHRFTQWRKSR